MATEAMTVSEFTKVFETHDDGEAPGMGVEVLVRVGGSIYKVVEVHVNANVVGVDGRTVDVVEIVAEK